MSEAIFENRRTHRTWTAMLSALGACYGCRRTLRNTTSLLDGFCSNCLERSRSTSSDELGGEA